MSSSAHSVTSVVEDIRAELVDWFEDGDEVSGIRFGSTRYIPLRVLVGLARAHFVREFDEDVNPVDVEDALRSMEDEGVSVERRTLPWNGDWDREEFVVGVGFKNGGGNDAGWAELVADVMAWADEEMRDVSDDDSDAEEEEEEDGDFSSRRGRCRGCVCRDDDGDEEASPPAPENPAPEPPRNLVARDIARFVGRPGSGFRFGEAEYMPLLDFQIAVLTLAKESGEFGEDPHLTAGETEFFCATNNLLILHMTMPWNGAWKAGQFVVGLSRRA
jgi:hypothetical protein